MTDHEQPAAGVALDLATGSQARIQCSTCHQPANPAHYCDHHNGGPWCDECWKVGDCAEVHGAGCRTTVWEPMDPEFSDGLDRAFLSAEAPTDAGGAVSEALRRLEQACDDVAAGRSQTAYNQMIADGQKDALLALDEARRLARAALTPAPQAEGAFEFPYQRTFNAIADAVTRPVGEGLLPLGISVEKFQRSFNASGPAPQPLQQGGEVTK